MKEIKKLVIIAVCLLSLSIGLVFVSNVENVAYASSGGSSINQEYDILHADIMDRYEQNLITYEEAEDEYSILSNAGISQNTDNITSSNNIGMMSKSSTKTVSGTAEWMPSSTATVPEPLRRVRIELRNGLTSPTFDLIAESYTDYNGNYTFTYNLPLLGDYQNLSIVVYAESDTFRVARDWTAITPLLEYRVSALFDLDVNQGDRLNLIYAYENNDRHKAFYISQGLVIAQKFAVNTCGLSTNKFLNVLYPFNISNNVTAFCWENYMGVSPNYATIDTVMHEYGHFVQHCVGTYGINVPGAILDSGFDFSIFTHYSTSDHLLHSNGKDFGMKLAWSEAWATAFAMIAQQHFLSELSWASMSARLYYTAFPNTIYGFKANMGEGQEDALIAFLWDLFGTRNTNLLAGTWTPLGNTAFWNTSTQSGTYTLTDFVNILSTTYPQFYNQIGTRLSYFKIAPQGLAVTNTFSQFTPPSLEWRVNGSQYNPNNQFRIAFYDASGIQKYETDNVSFSLTPDLSYPNRRDFDMASCTLTQVEWATALSHFTSGATINIMTKGYLSSEPVSGPYWSAYQTIIAPTILTTRIINGTTNAEITGAIGTLSGRIEIPSTVVISGTNYPVKAIGNSAFENQSMNEIVIPSSVISIGSEAFLSCTGLTSVNLSSNLETIGSSAFWGCTSITSLTIPGNVQNIGTSAFYGCIGITGLTLNSGVGDIGENVFYGCSGIANLTVPGSVVSIGENAFKYCTNIDNVVLQQGVSSVGDYAFYGCTDLTAVTIPQSVIAIGSNTFSSCIDLSSLTWYYNPNYSATDLNIRLYLTNVMYHRNVTTIGENAFWNCPNLVSITITNSVTSIGAYAFCLLDSITQILIPSSVTVIGEYAFSACSSLKIYSEANSKPSNWVVNWNSNYRPVYYYSTVSKVNCWHYVNSIPTIWHIEGTQGLEYTLLNGIFSVIGIGTVNLTTLVIPSTYNGFPVLRVGNGTNSLTNSEFLQTVVINDGVESIENNAFSECRWLSSITMPDSITSIGTNAFKNCIDLTTVPIPNNVASIGTSAFSGCTDLTALTIPQSVESIGVDAFENCSSSLSFVWNYNPALTSANFNSYYYTVSFPVGTSQISANAFANSSHLSVMTIPNTITSIGSNAFANCLSYLSITWNYNPAVMASTFKAYLTSVNFTSGLTSITTNAFANCTKLSSINIPNTITGIGSNAFYRCTGLHSLTIPSNVTSIGSNTFYGCTNITYFTIPNSVTSVGTNAFAGNPNYIVSWNYNPALTAVNFGSVLKYIYLPSGLTSFPANAFKGCTKITSFSIPSSVTSIGSSAFYGCTGISKINIPSNVTTMGSYVFKNCSNLTIYANKTSKPSGWQSTWNSSNRPVYWAVSSNSKDVMTNFGYVGSTYYWKGAVKMSIGNTNNCYYNTSTGVYAFNHSVNAGLTFAVRTASSKNKWSKITGSLNYSLKKNGSSSVVQSHSSSVSVSIWNSVSISNGSFSINTANLSNGTYTLTLNSRFSRGSYSDSDTRTFTFVIDR